LQVSEGLVQDFIFACTDPRERGAHFNIRLQADALELTAVGMPNTLAAKANVNPAGNQRPILLLMMSIVVSYGQRTRRAHCLTHEPHFKRRFMINL
jgi:hypothetical protein